MPYIDRFQRPGLDTGINSPANAGELNYRITTIIDEYITQFDKKYQTLNEVIGVLECCKLEAYRRVIAPYENTKIVLNGEVYKNV